MFFFTNFYRFVFCRSSELKHWYTGFKPQKTQKDVKKPGNRNEPNQPTKTFQQRNKQITRQTNKKHHELSNKHLNLQNFYGFLLGPTDKNPWALMQLFKVTTVGSKPSLYISWSDESTMPYLLVG